MISCFRGKFKVTSPRGYRTLNGKKDYHRGIDLVALGTDKSVYAIADGKIDATPYEANGFGYYVRQILPDGRRIYYGHLAKGSIVVKAGQSVRMGDKLGTMGSTGFSTGAHTHLELRVKGGEKKDLDISEFTGIPNKTGTYEAVDFTPQEAAKNIMKKAGLEQITINWLSTYKYADELFLKLWKAMQ